MRIMVMNEISKDYVTAAGGRGLSQRLIKWRHIFPNAVTPALTSSALAAASLVTGIFTIEIIFGFHGISEISLLSLRDIPDVPAVLGFAIYSVIMVQSIMILVDIIKIFLNPFLQEG